MSDPELGLELLQQALTSSTGGDLPLNQSTFLFNAVYLSLFPDVASLPFSQVGGY